MSSAVTFAMTFTCGECAGRTRWSQWITVGENTRLVTCSHCGARFTIAFEVVSFEPLTIASGSEIRRFLGVVKDGVFFSKEQLS